MAPREASLKFVEEYYTADLSERNSPESRWFLSWLNAIKGECVLSLGCGPNLLDDVLFFQSPPKEIVGIDINRSNIDFIKKSKNPELQKCRDILNSQQVKVELLVGDILEERADFIGRFDAVYAMGVIGMFERQEIENLLQTIKSYLKPSGVFLDIDWTDCKLSDDRLVERKGFHWYDTCGPSVPEIGDLIKASGFTVQRHEIYSVANPEEYKWGEIYGFLCRKT